MATHGNSALHNTILLDGMPAHTNLADGAVQNYIDNALISEATYQTSGVSAESSAGGVRLNLIPKDGGNALHGSGFFGGTSDNWHLQSTNLDDRLRARGLPTGARVQHLNDFNGSAGGPLVKDKLWWFGSARHQATYIQVPNTFKNDGSPGIDDAWINSYVVRGTWQATPRNKFAVTYQRNYKWKVHEILGGGQEGLPIFPEQTASYRAPVLYYIAQAKWTSPVTNRVLLEAGYSGNILHYSDFAQPGTNYERGTAAWYANASRLDTIGGGTLVRTGTGSAQPAQHAGSTFSGGVDLVRDRHAQRQDRHPLGLGQQSSAIDMNGDPLSDLPGRHARQRRLHAGPAGADSCLQLAHQSLAAAEGERRGVRAGPVGGQPVHDHLRDPLRVPEGKRSPRSIATPAVCAGPGLRRRHLRGGAGDDLLVVVVAATRDLVRPVRHGQDGAEGQLRPIHDAGCEHVCEPVQSQRHVYRHPHVDRHRSRGTRPADQRRQHRAGQRDWPE
jgi:hypothetical protein